MAQKRPPESVRWKCRCFIFSLITYNPVGCRDRSRVPATSLCCMPEGSPSRDGDEKRQTFLLGLPRRSPTKLLVAFLVFFWHSAEFSRLRSSSRETHYVTGSPNFRRPCPRNSIFHRIMPYLAQTNLPLTYEISATREMQDISLDALVFFVWSITF